MRCQHFSDCGFLKKNKQKKQLNYFPLHFPTCLLQPRLCKRAERKELLKNCWREKTRLNNIVHSTSLLLCKCFAFFPERLEVSNAV